MFHYVCVWIGAFARLCVLHYLKRICETSYTKHFKCNIPDLFVVSADRFFFFFNISLCTFGPSDMVTRSEPLSPLSESLPLRDPVTFLSDWSFALRLSRDDVEDCPNGVSSDLKCLMVRMFKN